MSETFLSSFKKFCYLPALILLMSAPFFIAVSNLDILHKNSNAP